MTCMHPPIPPEAREAAEAVLKPLLETLSKMTLPQGSDTAVPFRVPEEKK